MNVTVFGQHDQRVLDQLERCAVEGDAPAAVLCADGHLGYSQPIGGVVAYEDKVSPSGVGYDIGCGNKAVLTNLRLEEIVGTAGSALWANPVVPARETRSTQAGGVKNEASAHAYSARRPDDPLAKIADEIQQRISFGVGRQNDEPVDDSVLDAIRNAAFEPQRDLYDLAARQLGTVGAGNHYVDLFADEQDRVWVGVHFGSRGFGHKTASGFLALAQGLAFDGRASEGEMDSPPTLLAAGSDLGQAYIAAMDLAGWYAYAGRDVVCAKVLEILGAESVDEVHNHHNFAWFEEHDGQKVWVVRKGATPAFPGQRGFVGASMGEPAVILEGVESDISRDALYSTVHGAGRAMSRTTAAGKQRKRWFCQGCGWTQGPGVPGLGQDPVCPECGSTDCAKKWVRETEGAIDWDATLAQLDADGIVLRGGAADEAPGAYKRLPDVLAAHEGTVRVLHNLRPLAVVMAGEDTFDPYKD